ncbi:alkaline phosphatase D family protein [Microvirga puerhi]|uniref:Alkaline phosphatase D family protein n=1 Tax=Microvirga puerhi TaxID=2876078 RepID=A0ABS7VK07_9HYPH|nr:alkaline phosphatase D family protein [Microvirga puerhi]MBZ6075352.1 alkaline phosphatase D family protein [Microvirga puerhi]
MNDLTLPRRQFLLTSLGGALAVRPFGILQAAPRLPEDPFTLGVASGAPRPDSVVIWTRLAPKPLEGGGMPDHAVPVDWQVAEDDTFRRVVRKGRATAEPGSAHAVHVTVTGLRPGRWYWYRFKVGQAVSPVGRTRTAPAIGTGADLRFAYASCQQYEQGFFSAYAELARRDLDLIVHLGDYIYESSWGSRHVRKHNGGIPTTLPEFRERYALYKLDPDLQAAHAAFPWLSIWDDHEVANDYTDDRSPVTPDRDQFLKMRAAAYQAYYEHMPMPVSARPHGPQAVIYDEYRFGDMVNLILLDDRQYRSHHACLPGRSASPRVDCPERSSESRTMLGEAQERWVDQALAGTKARWTIVAQQTLMAERDLDPGDGHGFWMDGWDGYAAGRRRLLDSIATHRTPNPVVIGGDVHAFFAADLKRDFHDEKVEVLATEFCGTSITSEGPSAKGIASVRAKNPHIKYARGDKRGFAIVTLNKKRCEVGFEAVANEKERNSPVSRIASFVCLDGRPGVQEA